MSASKPLIPFWVPILALAAFAWVMWLLRFHVAYSAAATFLGLANGSPIAIFGLFVLLVCIALGAFAGAAAVAFGFFFRFLWRGAARELRR